MFGCASLSCTSLTREIDAFYPRDDDSFSVDEAIEMQHELNVEAMPSREIVPSWMTRHSIEGACIPDIAKFIESQTVLHLVARCGGKKSLRIRQHLIALDKKKEAKRHAIMVPCHGINISKGEHPVLILAEQLYFSRRKSAQKAALAYILPISPSQFDMYLIYTNDTRAGF